MNPQYYDNVCSGQVDIVGFTPLASKMAADKLVKILNKYFEVYINDNSSFMCRANVPEDVGGLLFRGQRKGRHQK